MPPSFNPGLSSVESTPTTYADSLIVEGSYSGGDSETQTSPFPVESYLGGAQQSPNVTLPQSVVATFMQFMERQNEFDRMKMEYMTRREEREERESRQRLEMDRMRVESERSTQSRLQIQILGELASNPLLETTTRRALEEYLVKLTHEPPMS